MHTFIRKTLYIYKSGFLLKHPYDLVNLGLSLSDLSVSVLRDLLNCCNTHIYFFSVRLQLLTKVVLGLRHYLVEFFAHFQTG